MNKLFIGLLIVAAGAGIFYYFNQRTCYKPPQNTLSKELLVGKWKAVIEQPAGDFAEPIYQYEFQQAGTVLRSFQDSAIADTSHYEWSTNNELVWKKNSADSVGKFYAVVQLTKDSLQLQSEDSITALFIKAK